MPTFMPLKTNICLSNNYILIEGGKSIILIVDYQNDKLLGYIIFLL